MDKNTEFEVQELLRQPEDCAIFSGHPAYKDPEHWCVGPVIEHRDSKIFERANAKALIEALEAREDLQELWEPHEFRHWAVGWVKHMSFKVLDEAGEPTPMFHFMKEWAEKLDDYPLADEEAYCEMEYEAAIENIETIGGRWAKAENEEWAGEIYRWLADNEPGQLDDHDGHGAWPSDTSVIRALKELGLYETTDEEEEIHA
jgi:hypothetical protein